MRASKEKTLAKAIVSARMKSAIKRAVYKDIVDEMTILGRRDGRQRASTSNPLDLCDEIAEAASLALDGLMVKTEFEEDDLSYEEMARTQNAFIAAAFDAMMKLDEFTGVGQ